MLKRLVLWIAGILVAVVVVVVLAFRFSPWPSVAIIEYMFSEGDTVFDAALLKHVPTGISAQIDIAYGDDPAKRLDVFRPEGTTQALPTIVWIHGGAWIAGSKGAVANYLKVLAGNGYATVGVEYSTGFGSVYPKPVEQVNEALAYLVGHATELHIDPTRIILAGDSAGAQIAAQTALTITDPGYARRLGVPAGLTAGQLRGTMLLSGAFDIEAVNAEGAFGWFTTTVLWAYSGVRDYLGDEKFKLVSVTRYVSKTFPPSFISSGNGDPLAPQAIALAQALEQQGATVDTLFFPTDREPALPHEYQFLLDDAAGQEVLGRMLAFAATWLAAISG